MFRRLLLVSGVLMLLTPPLLSQVTYPINDIASPREGCYAFTNATIVKDAQNTVNAGTLVIRKGKIEAVGVNIPIPKEAIVVDCRGKYIYPSFIDLYSDYGTQPVQRGGFNFGGQSQMLSNTKGAFGWNQAIKPEVDVSSIFNTNETKAKELRGLGFGAVLTHQMDGIARGTGSFVTLGSQKENMEIIQSRASAHYSFDKGSSTQDYPNSLMGSIALLRQTYLDASWYKNKPADEGTNLSLEAWNGNQSLPQIFEANDKWNNLRADKVGDEFGVQYIIKAGGNEYQRISETRSTNASYIVPVNFPAAMDVEDPNDARQVALSDLKHWELAATNLSAMEKAGINFTITLSGLRESGSFMANVRKAIQNGLTETKALEALTKTPATLIGQFDKVGSLEVGKLANFVITSGPIFGEKTNIFQNWIQGIKYVVNETGWKDYRGTYNMSLNNQLYKLELKGDIAKPAATIIASDTTRADVVINDKIVKINATFKKDSMMMTRLAGIISGDNWNGSGQLANGQWVNWTVTKTSDFTDTSKPRRERFIKPAAALTYPNNGYGFKQLPTVQNLIIKNATVWTNEADGVLKNADVWVSGGKIKQVGKNLSDPGARVIDGTGRHVSAGIIDEHSHIAGTGSINECSQSVTAEVRMADIVNPDDVNIYRQLSGGVTSSHLLHGSCNTIGGQTQLIKLRWGQNAESLKFANWDGFIKFALGENVKRSSNSQGNNRFPDTRMGVEELLSDAFNRAREYEKLGANKRRDLELDALLEILNKKRFITCHSYVQSEINGLIKVADRYGFTVNTFTHILEGYKVADKMKAHGAQASSFSDWWAYKVEVIDAIPQNPWLMHKVGINVAINSDDAEMARRLNQEAAKSVKYAGMDEQEALKMVTLNPANMLHVGDRTGSIKAGKDADLVLWTDHPLSIYAKSLYTIVDGIIYFDREKDAQMQEEISRERTRLIQKMIAAKKGGERTIPAIPTPQHLDFCEDDHPR